VIYHRIHRHAGDRDWVVLVHGAGGSSSVWFRQIRAYRHEFNLILVDLRGHGGSAALDDGRDATEYTFADVSRDILEVLDHHGIERAHFVGISLGCLIIRTLAEIAPERVSSMVLGGAIARLDRRSRFLVAFGNAFKRVVPFMWLYRLYAWILLPRRGHRESRLIFIREAKKLARSEFLRWFRLTLELRPILRLFEERDVGIPTLYLMGEQDHMFLPAARHLAVKHSRSVLRVIESCGHICNIERPAEFNRHSIEFLRDPMTSSSPS
jgi:pimeloyl-ACP methyl ester carboxylesterase